MDGGGWVTHLLALASSLAAAAYDDAPGASFDFLPDIIARAN